MGLLKSLIAGAEIEPETDSESPDEERRSAAEAALDRMIAARSAATVSVVPQPVPVNASVLAVLSERRSGLERRNEELALQEPTGDRRTGLERRSVTAKPAPAASFGRRGSRIQ